MLEKGYSLKCEGWELRELVAEIVHKRAPEVSIETKVSKACIFA